MSNEPLFRPDLYRGTAGDYDRYRPRYPAAMVDDLIGRTAPGGRGALLDLACGTGQISFAVLDHFAGVWAVDQEPDMIEVVKEKAAGDARIRTVVSAAERLEVPDATFEVVTIGNAFHRLQRETVAALAFRWLAPGGYLALCWARSPWDGGEDWQRALSAVVDAWTVRAAAADRVPEGWRRRRQERPDSVVLEEVGFALAGSYQFPTGHDWTVEDLIGFLYSTSFLSRPALGPLAGPFEADVRHELRGYPSLRQTIDFAYELARRPHAAQEPHPVRHPAGPAAFRHSPAPGRSPCDDA